MKKINTKALVQTAVLLAICIVSQFFKNFSVYVTGPIINACLAIAVMTAGLGYALALSIITPVTSFIITGSPIMAAIPAIIPAVMVGNAVYVIFIALLGKKRFKLAFPVSMAVGTVGKALFMGAVISYFLVPMLLPEKMQPMMPTVQATFSVTQFITAAIGSVYAYIINFALKKTAKNQ